MDCLTKEDAQRRLWYAVRYPSGKEYYCPDCLTQLRESEDDDDNRIIFYCPSEMCLNDTEYDLYGNDKEQKE